MPKYTDSARASASSQVQEQALAWFARLRDSKASDGDKAACAEWLRASPEHRAAFDKIERFWESAALDQVLSHYSEIPLHAATRRRNQPLRWAAAASVLLMSGWLLIASGLTAHWRADLATATGERRRVALADGSAMTLNTDSAALLRYAGGRRGVQLLRGEAYFEVKSDQSRPFVVTTGDGSVRVVGTRFTVKLGANTEVDVENGAVICSGRQSGGVRLIAGQHAEIGEHGVTQPAEIHADQTFAWLKGRLIFQDRTLAEVIAELDRYHPGVIVITDPKIARTRITGNYKLDDTDAVIRILAGIAGATVVQLSPYLTVLKS